jgi:hypothetical protein
MRRLPSFCQKRHGVGHRCAPEGKAELGDEEDPRREQVAGCAV